MVNATAVAADGNARKATVAVVGAGPAGLFAAERLATAGYAVTLYDQMPSPARKLLMAGRGGLNITHSEALPAFCARYGVGADEITSAIADFPPQALIAWCEGLGVATFVGSSGRVFPRAMKASPLVRAWLQRLDAIGVALKTRHRFMGFDDAGALRFAVTTAQSAGTHDTTTTADVSVTPHATLLALGGASWPRLGSDGGWADVLRACGVVVTPLIASNAGVLVPWTDHMRTRHAGAPLKRIGVTINGATARGEAMITTTGLEGGVIYALSSALRAACRAGPATLTIDLKPDMTRAELADRLQRAKSKDSLSNTLRKAAGLSPAAIALVHEAGADGSGSTLSRTPDGIAGLLKAVPITITGSAGLERAISSAGGVAWNAVDGNLMLRARPGVFVAGEMLDFDAPTGGYLLQAAFATAARAAAGIDHWLREQPFKAGLSVAASEV
ncbi:MAG: NAD(P)/FAD-dependent oxidoreductase [Hyphomicrobium sp.]